MLAGAVHLLFTGTDGPLPDGDTIARVVSAAPASARA